jgi:hypothetical protein
MSSKIINFENKNDKFPAPRRAWCVEICGVKKMSYNVPAVYDGLTARIEKCVAFLGLANCGCSEPWEWSVAE